MQCQFGALMEEIPILLINPSAYFSPDSHVRYQCEHPWNWQHGVAPQLQSASIIIADQHRPHEA
jgi:hypothetical protein